MTADVIFAGVFHPPLIVHTLAWFDINCLVCMVFPFYSDGVFSVKIDLAPGEYEYKYVVDSEWKENPNQVNNHIV